MSVFEKFPFSTFRPHQRETLEAVCSLLDAKQNVRLVAPVGSGKSPIALALARHYGSAYITTPLNVLVDQYEADFGNLPDVVVLKGRRNYDCGMMPGVRADDCPAVVSDKASAMCQKGVWSCEYSSLKLRCHVTPVVITNMSMMSLAPWLKKRKLLIVDEAQSMEGFVTQNVTVEFRSDEYDYPHFKTFEEYVMWLKKILADKMVVLARVSAEIEAKTDADQAVGREEIRRMNELDAGVKKIQQLLDDWDVVKEPWVFKVVEFRDRRRHRVINKLVFQPLTAARFLQRVFDRAERVVVMSATPPFPEDIGMRSPGAPATPPEGAKLDWKPAPELYTIDVPMLFPKGHRPIHRTYVGRMSKQYREERMPLAAQRILEVAYGRTLVHCGTYASARLLSHVFDEMRIPHVLQDQGDREGSLDRWLNGEGGAIFLSVNMTEGVSLDGDKCRTNVLLCIPYPDMGDPVVEARIKREGWDWYHRRVADTIAQAYGRAVRSDTDWANFYILDSNFGFWYREQGQKWLPKWFSEAIM